MKTAVITALSAGAICGVLAFATPAQANLTFTGGYAGTAPGGTVKNDLFMGLYGTQNRDGFYYGNVNNFGQTFVEGSINLTANVDVEFTYLGKEASYVNLFQVFYDNDGNGSKTWNTIFRNNGPETPVGTILTISNLYDATDNTLLFRFVTDVGPSYDPATDNLIAPNGGAAASDFCPNCSIFTTAFGGTGGPQATSNSTYDVFLDDSGQGNNDNHDDMAVRITAVPVPAALPIIAAALAGFGFAGYRSRRPNA